MIDEKKLTRYIKTEINPYRKPFDGTVFEFGNMLMDYIERMEKESERKWIPVSERLPEEPNYYEVTVDFGSKQITEVVFYSICESRWGAYNNDITAWRERLQEPYKAGEKE